MDASSIWNKPTRRWVFEVHYARAPRCSDLFLNGRESDRVVRHSSMTFRHGK
jgi:hypothetical protein